jgi:hypothetical protein
MPRTLLVVAAATATLALAAPGGAVIHPGSSIAGVKLGMTKAEVRAKLGEPDRIVRGRTPFGPVTTFRYFRLRVIFQGNRNVTAVKTTRKRERTPRGVGVGSTRAQVKARVRGVKCPEPTICEKGPLVPGSRVTVFRLFDGRVTSVLVGFVID